MDRKQYLRTHEINFKVWFKVTWYEIFKLESILFKIFWFLLCCSILIPISLYFENWALHLTFEQCIEASNNIIQVRPIGNPGILFSFLSDTKPWVVFFCESITIIVTSIALIFCRPKWYYMIPLSFIFVGAIMNTDSRSSVHPYIENSYYFMQHFLNPASSHYKNHNVVIDYWFFNTKGSIAIFNFNDCCVISGTIAFFTFLFINIYITYIPALKKEREDEKINKNDKTKNQMNK